MKKIAIVTFHRAINYGAVLQCYALSHYLKLNGAEVQVLDYYSDYFVHLRKVNFSFSIKGILKLILLNRKIIKKISRFDKFVSDKLTLSKRYNDITINEANSEFDYFIVGSDQVFNFDCGGNDENYFLKFVSEDSKKYSYAASFGKSELTENEQIRITELVKSFCRVSVREAQGILLMEKMGLNNYRMDIDPIFLLSRSEWEKIIVPSNKKYVFVYLLEVNPNVMSFIERFRKKTGLKVVMNGSKYMPPKFGYKFSINAGPIEWLSDLYNATYVITNSFHGLAFSIKFKKNFYVKLLEQKSTLNSRIENLIEITNLQDRIIDINSKEIKIFDNPPVLSDDFHKSVEDSREYLVNIFKEE